MRGKSVSVFVFSELISLWKGLLRKNGKRNERKKNTNTRGFSWSGDSFKAKSADEEKEGRRGEKGNWLGEGKGSTTHFQGRKEKKKRKRRKEEKKKRRKEEKKKRRKEEKKKRRKEEKKKRRKEEKKKNLL